MTANNAPILEFDPTVPAFIEPSKVIKKVDGIPQVAVFCFFQDVLQELAAAGELVVDEEVRLGSEIGRNFVYRYKVQDQEILVTHPGVGAPLAGGFMEELIAYGVTKIMACGGAGVLAQDIVLGNLVVPNAAIRDEGMSYHYLPASREVAANPAGVAALTTFLEANNVPHKVGTTWTTDGLYRETPKKIAARRAEGALTVEMETAAFIAVAQFRKIMFAQILYGGDDLTSDEWDSRDWNKQGSLRERLFRLAANAALSLPDYSE